MRIIAGTLKSRVIKPVPGRQTRPTSDKVKEAIFHKLGPFFEGGLALDLFAGSGSLGIEAISRGMDHVVFVENAHQAVRIIRDNTQKLKIESQSEVIKADAFRALSIFSKQHKQFDLILLDPPYEKISYEKVLDTIQVNDLLSSDGFVYVETSGDQSIVYESTYYEQIYEKKYSNTTSVMILKKHHHQ